ncbi:glycosyltransferase [Arthrobacter agilis]|uniref:glycosyltransferase n=1 Tax=Arthrobacter agilis TaxID=37921 RepID=UPI00278058E5|nr:glycosyltransferase [Arthrobacter agilis]MDQ0734049.1 glycosyltransferase involved in cell wall biosynthesis [Arthrobacter agilis]
MTLELNMKSKSDKKDSTIEGELPRALWITNFAAPYRLPVWRELSSHFALDVRVLVGARNFHLDARNRGDEWSPVYQSDETFSISTLKTYRVPKISRPLHFLGAIKERTTFRAGGSILIGGWEEPAYWQSLIIAKIKGIKAVGFYESTLESQTHKSDVIAFARSVFFRLLDAVVVPGVAAGEAVEGMGVDRSKIFEGFNAVDVAAFSHARLRSVPERGRKGHKFLFVGRLIELKNIASIIEAFAVIAAEADTLTLIGSGELEGDLRQQVDRLGLNDRVLFLGRVAYSHLPDLMVQYDTLVLASLTEVWGLVVNEALAAGLHCIVGDRCGVALSVRDMRGVYITGVESADIATSMSISRDEWGGPLLAPEILQKTPELLALTFAAALQRNR